MMILVLLLPLFGQTLHYIKDLPPLWALSKAFPILSLPLIWPLLSRPRLPLLTGWLLAFLWLLLVSSFIGMFTFDQNFPRGLTAQVKLLPMFYIFSFLGFLLILRPSLDEMQTAFIWCGVLTFLVVFALRVLAPTSWYSSHYDFGDAPLLSIDDRGYRIRMPMYFGLIGLFLFYRRFLQERTMWSALFVAIALALVVGIVRTRAVVLATAGTLICISFMAASPRWRVATMIVALIGAVGLLQIPYVSSAFDTSSASGFDLRWVTVVKTLAFLDENPWRWIFGSGTISSLDPAGLPRFFNHFFFLADITWLGIVFEFGLVGAAIFLALLIRLLFFTHHVRQRLDMPLLGGLQDYVLYTILISPLYSTMTLQPGEIALIGATFIYCWMLLREQPRDGEPAA